MMRKEKRMMERLTPTFRFEEDELLLKQMKEEFYACPAAVKYIRSLHVPEELIDEEIVKIYDFVQDLNFCKKCPGVYECNKQTPRLCTKIIYEDGVISRVLVPCKEYLKMVKFKGQFVVRDFEDDWLTSDLKRLDRTNERLEVIQKYKNFIDGTDDSWIFIMGEAGTGRTFVAANLAIDIAKREKGPIAFIDAPSRFKELMSKKDNNVFNELLQKYIDVPVLIIDDLGNEYKSDFVRESILFPILNNRAKQHKFTIITSDFNINDIATMYLTGPASKPKIEQIKRLLKKVCGKEINLGDLSVY